MASQGGSLTYGSFLCLLACFSPVGGRGGLARLVNGEVVAVGVCEVSREAPPLFAGLRVFELHAARFQFGKGLAAVIDLKHPARADAWLLVTGG